MKGNEKKWLSDYEHRRKGKEKAELSTREIIKMHQKQTQEVRVFLRAISQKRKTERERYEEPIKST